MQQHLGFPDFARKFATAAALGVQTGIRVAQSRDFQTQAKRNGKKFLWVFAAVYTVALVLWIPIALVIGLIDGITGADMGQRIPSAFSLMCKCSETLGPLLLLVLNWKASAISEEFFFGQLQEVNWGLAEKLHKLPLPPVTELLRDGLRRYGRFAVGAIGILIISLLPGGPTMRGIVEAVWDWYLMFQVFGYYSVSIGIAGLRAVPQETWQTLNLPITGWHVSALVKTFFLARSVSREILEPYLARARVQLRKQPKGSEKKGPTSCEVDGLILCRPRRKDSPTLLGFALPFALLMSTPIVGPVTILFAQAAAAHLVAPMLTDSSRRFK